MVQIENDVYTQIGLVMLIGLGAKNSILIVAFAKEQYERGMPLVEAALEAARLRFRPAHDDGARIHCRLRAAVDRIRRGIRRAPDHRHDGDRRHGGGDVSSADSSFPPSSLWSRSCRALRRTHPAEIPYLHRLKETDMRASFYIGIAVAAVTCCARMHRRPELQAAAGRGTGKLPCAGAAAGIAGRFARGPEVVRGFPRSAARRI